MPSIPIQPRAARQRAGITVMPVPTTARAAPASSSPMRAGSRKNADDGRRGGQPQADDEAGGGQHGDRRQHESPVLERAAGQYDEQRWPAQVELLLDRQRPVVQQWRRVARAELGAEVVAEAVGEHEVDRERAGGDGVRGQRSQRQGRQHSLGEHHRDDHGERRRRKQAAGSPAPEVAQRDRAAGGQLAEDQPGDEEAGHDEEHVDADEPTADTWDTDVEGDDGDDGDRSKPFDVWSEAALEVTLQRSSNRLRGRRSSPIEMPPGGRLSTRYGTRLSCRRSAIRRQRPRFHPWMATYPTTVRRSRTSALTGRRTSSGQDAEVGGALSRRRSSWWLAGRPAARVRSAAAPRRWRAGRSPDFPA